MSKQQSLLQRAEYTHKYNLTTGRHGWLRLTPAYSVKIVEDLIKTYNEPLRILDPFCGTATTALSAAYHGHAAVTLDINPFLIWLGQAKTSYYTSWEIESTRITFDSIQSLIKNNEIEPAIAPPIYNIERWWDNSALLFLRLLKAAISITTEPRSAQHTLLLVAFCRTLIELSNAAFNHQSMSFKAVNNSPSKALGMLENFNDNLEFVLNSALVNPAGSSEIILGDARFPPEVVTGSFDLVITSPPYANRMSYIRELRPYMYWLDFLTNGREAGNLDWRAIGGTWGIATSRLLSWERSNERYTSTLLEPVLDSVSKKDNKNGKLLANYIAKYFDDMWKHFSGLRLILSSSANIHYIVGNSTFYNTLLPVEQIYVDMLHNLEFVNIKCQPIRKRNSKKELVEFDVTATWL